MDKKSKTVNMNADAGNQPEKMSYEQLEQIAGNLNQQCRILQQQLNQAQGVISEFNEIGMLLDILKQAEQFTPQFVERCANKVEELITKALDASEKKEEAKNSEQN